MVEKTNDKNINETLRLKKSYIRYPLCLFKRFILKQENIWKYSNIYNEYFCSCIGLNCKYNYMQKCKYYFYLNIIDNNRNIYKKPDSLFIYFIFDDLSSDDAYPVFKEMAYQNLPVHYITENLDIYNEFCYLKNKCLTVIYLSITHGVCYFKYFLYEDYACYGKRRIDKILDLHQKK